MVWLVDLNSSCMEPRSELLHNCSRHLSVTFLRLAGGPEWFQKGAQVRAVTLRCSRHLIVTCIGPGAGPEWLLQGVQVRAVMLLFQSLERDLFWSECGPERPLKGAEFRAVTLLFQTLVCDFSLSGW